MGLDISHDAFHGAYSAFNRFRKALARAMGGSFPPHDLFEHDDNRWYWGHGYSAETHPGLTIFFCHSDCDGEMTPEECALVIRDLAPLVEKLPAYGGGGHIESAGGYRAVGEQFLRGCQAAIDANENLEFH